MPIATNRVASDVTSFARADNVSTSLHRTTMAVHGAIGFAKTADPFAHAVAVSPQMREAILLARQVAESPLTTVLLEGETGTGKELFARGIHNASDAAGDPFVGINCAAIPENLLEAELFGHERGAFTGAIERKMGLIEHAQRGTLFLDELQQLPLGLQAKLLRVLEDRTFRRVGGTSELPVRCRVIAGTNSSLELAVSAGRFREDLYFRLNVFRIELLPLRDRLPDVVPIAEHFLHEIAARRSTKPKRLHDDSCDLLRSHNWPGNAREVRNVIERACILATTDVILPAHLKLQRRELVSFGDSAHVAGIIAIPNRGKTLEEIEREAIRLTMLLTAGNVSAAARLLGISRPTLMRKMREGGFTRRSLLASS
jgi:transcriptional regulator with PAS, ATPase and Fis domain